MILDEVIERYRRNAEYERTHGNLQGCLEFRQLVKWLEDYKRLLEQETSGDAISRQAVLDLLEDTNNGWIINEVLQLPTVTPQEPSITWVTRADGAKIAFWDVPVWKVTKICEILGEPKESEDEKRSEQNG